MTRCAAFAVGLLLIGGTQPSWAEPHERPAVDVETIQPLRVPATGPGLTAYLQSQTASPERLRQVAEWIQQLGSPSFRVRQTAQMALIEVGRPALTPLQQAVAQSESEVRARAKTCIERIEQTHPTRSVTTVIQLLQTHHTEQTLSILLDYLPHAGDAAIHEQGFETLAVLAGRTEPPSPQFLAGLTHSSPILRMAAAHVLGQHQLPAVREKVRPLLADRDVFVRFRAAVALARGQEKAAVPVLIALLAEDAIRPQAENVLCRLAGDDAPSAPSSHSAEVQRLWRDAWAAWWQKHGATLKMDLIDSPIVLGLTLCVEFNSGRVWEIGPDGKVRWEIRCEGPMDAQILPGHRVLIAESGKSRVTERDFSGKIHWEYVAAQEPINCRRLANGTTWIGTRQGAMAVTREGKQLWCESRTGHNAVRWLSNGHYLQISYNGLIRETTPSGKVVRQLQLPGNGLTWADIDTLPNGRYLISEYGANQPGRVYEIDAAGKIHWEAKVDGVCGVERLPNGRTLVACPHRVAEIDRTGKVVWESPSAGYVRRAHRR